MINYDFFKIQIILKDNIIKNTTPEKFFQDTRINNIIFNKFLDINYDNSIIIQKTKEIKNIINNIELNIEDNYIKKIDNKNYIFIQSADDSIELEEFFEYDYDMNKDIVILLKEGIFSHYITQIEMININYTFFSLGHYNYTKYIMDNINYIEMFKKCINIGYNTTGKTNFPGISVGIPLYNNHYQFYDNIDIYKEKIKENFDSLYKVFKDIIFNINNNFNLLNLINNNTIELIKEYDNKNYISIQDMVFFLNLEYKQLNIIYKNNDYLLMNKFDIVYPELLNKFKNNFQNNLQKFSKEFQNKFLNSKILSILQDYIQQDKDLIELDDKNIKTEEVKISKDKKVTLDNYLKNMDKIIDNNQILF